MKDRASRPRSRTTNCRGTAAPLREQPQKQNTDVERLAQTAGKKERKDTQYGRVFIGDPPIQVRYQVNSIAYTVLWGGLDR